MSALEHDELGYRARELRALLREWNATSRDIIRATIADAAQTLERAADALDLANDAKRDIWRDFVVVIKAAGGEVRASVAVHDADMTALRVISFNDAETSDYVWRLEGSE